MKHSTSTCIAAVVLALVLTPSILVTPVAGQSAGRLAAPPPRFEDAERARKLAAAFPEIDRVFREYAERARVPGIAYGVLIDGQLAHAGGVGVRDVASKAAVDPDTVFRIASMTKSFTALSILKLRDEGRLSLDDLAERYVPELKGLAYPTDDSPRITIRHLLSHAEGFPEDNPWGDRQLAASEEQFSEMLRRGVPFSNPPGLAYEYSNLGFAILGRIVSRASGIPYNDYVRANILKPLGMTSTTLDPSQVPPARLAHGYRWEAGEWKDEPHLADGAFGSMGGMLTSVRDLGRYVGFLMSAWPPRDDPDAGPVRRASMREMQQVWRAVPAGASLRRGTGEPELRMTAGGYGFGLRISQTCEFGHVVAHGGGLPGFGSLMQWLPEYGVGIITMANLTYTGGGPAVAAAMDALRRTGALQPRVIQPSPALVEMQDAVTRLVGQWDEALADRIAAHNLFLDQPQAQRRQALEGLRAKVGACRAQGRIDAENALRGTWDLACERGTLRAAITLAPTMPPRVQWLVVQDVPPGAPPRRQPACRAE